MLTYYGWGETTPPRANGFLEEVEPSLEHAFRIEAKHPKRRLLHLVPLAAGGNIINMPLPTKSFQGQVPDIRDHPSSLIPTEVIKTSQC